MRDALADLREAVVFSHFRVRQPVKATTVFDEQAALHARMADPSLYQSAPQEVAQIKVRMEALEGEIEAAMLRWEELESRTVD